MEKISSIIDELKNGTELKMLQCPILNQLTLLAKAEKNEKKDSYKLNYIIYSFSLARDMRRPIKASTLDLKNFFMLLIGNDNFFITHRFSFSAVDYFNFVCKENNSTNRKQLKDDLSILDSIIFSGRLKLSKKNVKVLQANQNNKLFSFAEYNRGMVTIQFSSFFQEDIRKTGFLIPFNHSLMGIDSIKASLMGIEAGPLNYNLKPVLFKLHLHRHSNLNRSTQDILRIETLLEHFIGLPYYKRSSFEKAPPITNVNGRLIASFEECLNNLQKLQLIKWDYCNPKKIPLSDFDKANMQKYSFWITKYIKFELL